MTALTGKSPSSSYKDMIQVSNGNSGIDATLRPIESGAGVTSALLISQTAARVAGPLDFAGSNHAGITLNNLTTAQRNALAPLAAGMKIFNTTTGQAETYNGTAWVSGGAVSSVNGRTGAVTAQAGDYSIAQITGASAVAASGNYADLAGKPTLGPLSGGVTVGTGLSLSGGTLSATGAAAALANVPGGTNAFLPTNQQTPAKPVQYSHVGHFTPVGGGNVRLAFANWVTSGSGEQLANANMQSWRHYAAIEYNGVVYPVTFNGLSSGVTANGAFVLSDPVAGLHFNGPSFYYSFHTAVPSNYRSGSGAPAPSLGVNGDTYYDNVAKVWYAKSAGAWGGSLGTNPWLANGYVVPVTHYTRGAFGEYAYTGSDATQTYTDGSFARGAKLSATTALASGTLTFNSLKIVNGGQNFGWDLGVPGIDILDLSQVGAAPAVGPVPAVGTPAAGYGNAQGGSFYALTANTNVGSTYAGPLAVGFGNTTQAWGPSLITMTPDVTTPWAILRGDSITSGVGSSDGDGDAYRQFGIYQRTFAKNAPPTVPTLNWGVPGITAQALVGNMAQSRALFLAGFPQGGGNVFLPVGTNDYGAGTPSTLASVKASIQSEANWWKNTALVKYVGLGTILPRVTSTDAFATETNQTPINAVFSSGGDVDTHNAQVLAGTLITNQDWFLDLRSFVQGTDTHKWKVSGAFTQSANGTTFPPTADGIHPSKPLMVYAAQQVSFPSLSA